MSVSTARVRWKELRPKTSLLEGAAFEDKARWKELRPKTTPDGRSCVRRQGPMEGATSEDLKGYLSKQVMHDRRRYCP